MAKREVGLFVRELLGTMAEELLCRGPSYTAIFKTPRCLSHSQHLGPNPNLRG
jgi:hypothetical protein